MQEFLSGNLIIPVRSIRKKSGSIDESTVASASPRDFSCFQERTGSFNIPSNAKSEMKKIDSSLTQMLQIPPKTENEEKIGVIPLFPHISNMKNFKMMKSKHRVILCKAAKEKKKINRKVKDKKSREAKEKKARKRSASEVETLATYKLFRISVLQNNRHFRSSNRRIVLPILSNYQRKKVFKKNESAQKIMDLIKSELKIEGN